jgi:poly-beta-1,6-N-acetyl-D-glucosamine synthase
VRYDVITPARDEADYILRLAECLANQSVLPSTWVIVDNGSADGTDRVADELASAYSWVRVVHAPGAPEATPGAPVVRAFHAGLTALGEKSDVVVKLDADVSFDADHFERLLDAFGHDPTLGIAGPACWESNGAEWAPVHVAGTQIRGASRAYRRECLEALLPFPETMGWDGIDELKANVLGWKTGILEDLAFKHHRKVGERDGARHRRWVAQGRGARTMGYRGWYLVVRALHHARRDPAALAMIWGYLATPVAPDDVLVEPAVRAQLREQQRLRNLPIRIREVRGRRA